MSPCVDLLPVNPRAELILVTCEDVTFNLGSSPSGLTNEIKNLMRFEEVAKSVRGTQGVREPIRWSILVVGAKLQWLGDVEATSEAEAIAKGAEEFKQPRERLMAVRR
jgi:hypothetical protein